jgi:hypothetical protein
MLHSKQHYRDIKANGFEWVGFDCGVHMFQKEIRENGRTLYALLRCTEEHLTNCNFEFMADQGYTLSDEKVKQIQKKYKKAQGI